MRAVIPVAGIGTRLRPHTFTQPKVLLNVAGKPILGHILDAIQEQGITKVTIVTGYMRNMVEEFVRSRYDMDVSFVVQQKRNGLGHAIWTASETFDDEPLMIILGDTVFDVDLKLAHQNGKSSLGVREVEDPSRFGVVVKNDEGNITKLIEKPESLISNLALVGIYYITNPNLLKESLNDLMKNDIKTRGEYQLTDALQIMIDKGEKFITFPVDGWYDCGKRETMLSTNRFLLDRNHVENKSKESIIIPPCYIDPKATIKRSVVGPYATVAEGAVVKDSVIRDSIISNDAMVTASLLDRSIIGNNASVNGKFYCLNVGNSSEINQA